jgi:hypothetical protein
VNRILARDCGDLMKQQPQAGNVRICPHCGGQHWGQRFDNCPYVELVDNPSATDEQKANARDWLRLQRESVGREQ